jgi:hypothetical protein
MPTLTCRHCWYCRCRHATIAAALLLLITLCYADAAD